VANNAHWCLVARDAPDGDDSLDGMRAALKDDAEYLKAQLEKQSKTITAEVWVVLLCDAQALYDADVMTDNMA
jgi:hypothetical protein